MLQSKFGTQWADNNNLLVGYQLKLNTHNLAITQKTYESKEE